MVGAWRGSSDDKVEEISGIAQLERLMRNKRLRWAASVYARHMSELRRVAERIIREKLGEEAVLVWMEEKDTKVPEGNLKIVEL